MQPMRWLNMHIHSKDIFILFFLWGGEGEREVWGSIFLDLNSLKCVPQNVPQNKGQPHYHQAGLVAQGNQPHPKPYTPNPITHLTQVIIIGSLCG
jgi:hypothetical protein